MIASFRTLCVILDEVAHPQWASSRRWGSRRDDQLRHRPGSHRASGAQGSGWVRAARLDSTRGVPAHPPESTHGCGPDWSTDGQNWRPSALDGDPHYPVSADLPM